ncbi:MAG: TonB-dependent receptor, partial [Holophagae bacterium]
MKKALCFMACLVLGAGFVHAQSVTSGALSGEIFDTNGDAIPGVRVLATDLDTSKTYGTVTDVNGQFRIPNVKPGMYKVDASLAGFQSHTWQDVTVRLGERTNLTVALGLAAAEGEIVVVGESSPLISPTKMGVTSSVSQGSLEALPTIDRSIYDFARTNPVFSTFSPGVSDGDVLSVSGRNNRYNNIQIDGSVNNDVFGLAATGTPGGQTGSQPIQLDAVQELQLVTSSFDVRQGGFTGGAVNVITKSGSNAFRGSVFGYYSDDNMVGNPEEVGEFGTFEDTEYGFSIGGPISRDKLFFFVNYGHRGYDAPTGFSLDGSSGQAWQGGEYTAEAEEFRQYTIATYGYDPGGLGEVTRERPSDKVFARVDWNINPSNTVYARHNFVDGSNIIIRPNNFFYNWPGNAYDFQAETNSTVAQWDAIFGDNAFNELRVTFQTIRGPRVGVGARFPQIRIEDVGGGSGDWQAGTEAFSTFNALDQDIWELTNDFTFFMGNHEIVIGTHNEFYSFDNLFIQ